MSEHRGESAGPATDRLNDPVIDPTANVLQLVEAAIRRQDDLRELESQHLREIAGLRAEYQMELRLAETERINAIRAVDVQAVQQAATVAETRATALANQVAQSAEAMRNQVAAAASAAATSLAAALVPIQEAIADLRRAQYETQGQKNQVVENRDTGAYRLAIFGSLGLVLALTLSVLGFTLSRATKTTPAPVVVTVTQPAATAPAH